jgi:hypothetical protein
MKHIILFLAVMCAGLSFVADSRAHWAIQVCTAVGDLCHRPLSFAVAAAALAALWIMVVLVQSFVED